MQFRGLFAIWIIATFFSNDIPIFFSFLKKKEYWGVPRKPSNFMKQSEKKKVGQIRCSSVFFHFWVTYTWGEKKKKERLCFYQNWYL